MFWVMYVRVFLLQVAHTYCMINAVWALQGPLRPYVLHIICTASVQRHGVLKVIHRDHH